MRLTYITEEQNDMETMEDFSTASMVEYGLRSGCTDAEYHMANRMQRLRQIALRLAKELEGYGAEDAVTTEDLEAIDVMVEVTGEKRIFRQDQ